MTINPIFVVTVLAVGSIFFVAMRGIRQKAYTNVDVKGFKEKINQKDVLVLDVRTEEEVAGGKIGNAIHIDVNNADFSQKMLELDKNKTYLVYCRSGVRSIRACDIMYNAGFDKLLNLQGGYLAWLAATK